MALSVFGRFVADMSRALAVVGDLHYEPHLADQFVAARRQLAALTPEAVIQLGDHGGYSHCGSQQSFDEGLEFLSGFDCPTHTIIGNHDLEGAEFARDEQSIAAFCQTFALERPYYTLDLGDALAICLSSTAFRTNLASHHEVHLDPAQLHWLRATLAAQPDRPTFVFSHAPILGSGARVLQSVHLKCPNAWLNHTDQPAQFARLVEEHPQIKLWFSAHNHLGQQYVDSITRLGQCTCVHTGVIGDISRDGRHQSRMLAFDAAGFELSTVDHDSLACTVDVEHDYRSGRWNRLSASAAADESVHFAPPPMPRGRQRLAIGDSVFAIHRDMVVEYDRHWAAPLGVVHERLAGAAVRVKGETLEVIGPFGGIAYRPGIAGRYSQIFAPNPWRSARRSA
ncbi:MAG TPA: metallophosphoesterase [Pirellulales bacterium]|nr:metallophosphoesterase [Pirellulales bacterium]